jgi:alkylhydroperoxidase family enzyme
MPRLSKLDLDNAPPDVKPIFEAIYQKRGNIPNMFRTMGHRPEILKTMDAHFKAVMAPTTLSVRLKELVVLRVSEINGCDY